MAASPGKETEIKLRVDSPGEASRRIAVAGFEITRARVFETNLLLDTAHGSLQARGEALRVRERGGETILTYKGPVERGLHKSREEIETAGGEASALLAIFARLGFVPTWRYEKFRTEFTRPGEAGVATLDETPIGVFIELEGDGNWIDSSAAHLGFLEKDYITESYSALFRQYCQQNGFETGAGMTFGEPPSGNLRGMTTGRMKDT